MLLPSDIARLVLGYLQQEGLCATTKAFILESPNLKEYAEHSTDDGAIPACVFSVFGKNLTTILNEYVAVKAKESCQETQVPVMMTSLWKKLDFTLNQIKSMQNSPAVYQNQRLRTRNGILNMRGQRSLSSCSRSPSMAPLSVPLPSTHDTSPLATPQGMLGPSTPVCYSSLQTRPSPLCVSQPPIQDVGRLVINVNRESPLHIVVPDRRINSGPLSPGRRKCDSPRRRGGGLCGQSGTGRPAAPSSGPLPDEQNEALQGVAENFPQMVIENAREKILNDKSLQEKLAENINKILGSDINPQSSKQVTCSSVVPDQSIDEILGLQGEIHMSDDAIRDILEQTESDPAFQALFDLFDYGKNKDHEGQSQFDTSLSNTIQESDEADPPSQTGDPGTSQEEITSGAETSSRFHRTRSTQDHKSKKTRKTTHPVSNASKSTPRLGQKRNSKTKSGAAETMGIVGSDRKSGTVQSKVQSSVGKDSVPTAVEDLPSSTLPAEDIRMEFDDTAETTVLPACAVQSFAPQTDDDESSETTKEFGENANLSISTTAPISASTDACPQKSLGADQSARLAGGQTLDVQVEVPQFDSTDKTLEAQPHLSPGPSKSASEQRPNQLNISGPIHPPSHPDSQKTSSVAVPPGANAPNAPSIHVHSTSAGNTPLKEPDLSNIVSLKIIVSDEADNQSGDLALAQAVSSIAGERLPTIILSSPAKSPVKAPPAGTSSITQEETVQAVCCLQGADLSSLTGKIGETVMGLPGLAIEENVQLALTGDLSQEAGYIQLVPGATSFGSSSNYFIVADPAVNQQSKLMVLPGCPPLGQAPPASHMLTTPPCPLISVAQDASQAYSPGSTLFISSPSQPMLQSMMVPVSVVGQSSVGKFTVVQNQLLQVTAQAVKTPGKAKPKPKMTPKDQAVSGKASAVDICTKTLDLNSLGLLTTLKPQSAKAVDSSQSSEVAGQQQPPDDVSARHAPVPSSSPHTHRRVLCFDVSAENAEPVPAEEALSPPKGLAFGQAAPISASCGQQPQKGTSSSLSPGTSKLKAIQPSILRGSRTFDGKTRPEVKNAHRKKPSEPPKESEKRDTEPSHSLSSRASEHGKRTKSTNGEKNVAPPEPPKQRLECRRKSHQLEKKDGKDSGSTHMKSVAPGHRMTLNSTGSKKLAEEKRRAEKSESMQKGKEAWPERRGSSQPPLHITANKENEVEQSRVEQPSAGIVPHEELGPAAISLAAPAMQGGSSRAPSMTSPLIKQAAEMLQDIQGHSPDATPTKKLSLGSPRLPLPRTPGSGCHTEEPPDSLRTPIRHRPGRDCDGLPRPPPPPAAPDIPTCSPASETGSESSINMAAHTLMILSRAAIARTGTPLKERLRHQGVLGPTSPKGKKRKLAEPTTSPTLKKEAPHSGSAASKRAKKPKKMLDSFPDNLDVDKFLSSLHYDE